MKCQLEVSAAMHSQWFEYFLCKLGTAVEHTALDSFEKQVMGWGLKEKSINQYMKYFHCYHFLIFFFFLNQPEHLQAACHISLIATFLFIFPPLSTAACASVAKFLLTPRPAAAASPQLRWGQRCNICAVIREITQCNFTVQQNRLIACMHCVCVP